MNNENEQIFKCKIGYSFYFIKLYLTQKQINIEIESNNSGLTENAKYINNYSLSHLQEINSYFKIFQSIQEIYKNILKLLTKKKFFIIPHEDNTLSFILKIKVHNNIKKIILTLSKVGLYNQKKIFNENYNFIGNLNYELANIRDKINALEQNQYILTSSNNYLPTSSISINNENNNQIRTIIAKLNQLENDNNDKNKQIKILEKQLKEYENKKINDSINEGEEEGESEEKDNINNINDINDIYYKKNENQFLKNSKISFNNNSKNREHRNYSLDKMYSINSDYIRKNYNHKKSNNYYAPKRENSMDDRGDINQVKTYAYRNINNKNKLKSTFSVDQLGNNYGKVKTFMPSSNSKFDKYLNTLPTIEKETINNLNSKIIYTNKEYKLITNRISQHDINTVVKLKLLYRASVDGDFETAVNFKCQKKLITLTLFHTTEGARFGFYIEKRKKTSIKSGEQFLEIPGTSFLVGLNNLVYYNVHMKKNSLYYKNDNLLCFGFCSFVNNNKTRWLVHTSRNNFIGKKYLFGDKNDVYLNLNTKKIIGNNLSYHIKDVEVFEVIIKHMDE